MAAFYTQDAQQFSRLWQSFYGQRGLFLKERDAILSVKEEDE